MTREEAIDLLDNLIGFIEDNHGSDYDEAFKIAIKALEQEPRWIPVSERLPEKEGRYLTTILNEYDNELRYIMTCDYFSNGCWCPDDECASDNVIAWMPLPEPYKAESEVTE